VGRGGWIRDDSEGTRQQGIGDAAGGGIGTAPHDTTHRDFPWIVGIRDGQGDIRVLRPLSTSSVETHEDGAPIFIQDGKGVRNPKKSSSSIISTPVPEMIARPIESSIPEMLKALKLRAPLSWKRGRVRG